jgi:hypothetical protein
VFDLSKWYADAVSAAGNYWIGNSAQLRIGSFSAGYSSVFDDYGERHSPQACTIAETPRGVHWRLPALGIAGNWRTNGRTIRKVIYQDGDGVVDWECLAPCAFAATGGITGLGYVDRLRLTIPPWNLPIRRLRWGRFLSERQSVVWIDWAGGFNSTSVFRNGKPVAAACIEDDGLVLDGGLVLRFDRGLVIGPGVHGATFLGAPGLDRFAPMGMPPVEESKWRSAATLEEPGEAPVHGWAIHELFTRA